MKTCSKCREDKPLNGFGKNKLKIDGLASSCKECRKATYKLNRESIRISQKKYYDNNTQKILDKKSSWGKSNRDEVRWLSANKRAIRLTATPDWLNEDQLNEIKDIYKNCPEGYHVDHIVPLKGKTVRGMHVPWNLQYLTASENLSKGNRLLL